MVIKDSRKRVEALTHDEARRRHIPTAEYQSVMKREEEAPIRVAYGREAGGLEREKAGRIAVKVINHLGDEVMKVFRV